MSQEPEARDELELKSDKQYYSRLFAQNGFKAACTQVLLILLLLAFGPEALSAKITGMQDFFTWVFLGFIGITGAYVGLDVAMNKNN